MYGCMYVILQVSKKIMIVSFQRNNGSLSVTYIEHYLNNYAGREGRNAIETGRRGGEASPSIEFTEKKFFFRDTPITETL